MAGAARGGSSWSWRIGTVLGIPIRVHVTFLLVLVWFGTISHRQGDDLVLALGFVLAVFGCVVLHELGHATMALRFGVRTRDIVLYPVGGVARLENIPGGLAELLIAVAGPAVNVVIFTALAALFLATPLQPDWAGGLVNGSAFLTKLMLANLLLAIFNLLPAFPMDGGRILRAGLSLALPEHRATAIATRVGQLLAILLGIAAIVLWGNPLLALIALFVFLGASQEALQSRQRRLVRGARARDAMITRFEHLAPQDSLDLAARRLLETHQQDFPVIDAWGRVVGALSRTRLLEGLAAGGPDVAVLEVMERQFPVAAVDDELGRVLEQLRARPLCPVLVLDDAGQLVGMITLDNLGEYMEVARRTDATPADERAGV